MTAPMIGNYGVNAEDMESSRPQVSGVVVRELARKHSNWRATESLDGWLGRHDVPVLTGVDTRRLTRHIRSKGAMRGVIAEGEAPSDAIRQSLLKSRQHGGVGSRLEGHGDGVLPAGRRSVRTWWRSTSG